MTRVQLQVDPDSKIIATARNVASSEGLQNLQRLHSSDRLVLLDLDVTSSESIQRAVEQVDRLLPNGIDYFISNAGVSHQPLAKFEDL